MKFEENHIYHIYNRGNNQQPIFFNDENYLFFLRKIKKELTPYCKILAYCLMPNHFHLMVYVDRTRPTAWSGRTGSEILSRKIGTVLSSYTQAINKEKKRTGSLFQQKTKSKCLLNSDENYPIICFHYIHQNPLKASLVNKVEDWAYSSFRDYVGLRNGTLPNIECCKQLINIPLQEKELYEESYELINDYKIEELY